MKKVLLLSTLWFYSILSWGQPQVYVTFSTDFTETDTSLFLGGTSNTFDEFIQEKGVYLIYGKSANFGAGTRVAITKVGNSLIFASNPISLDKNTLYEYYFQIGTDGYFAESSFDDMARLAPGYYRFFTTNTDENNLQLDPVTFNGVAPAGKKMLRVKVDMTGIVVLPEGMFAISDNMLVPLVNVALALNIEDENIYEGILYAPDNSDLTYTFYNGVIPDTRLIDENTYTVKMISNNVNDAVSFSTQDLYEAANHDLYDHSYIQRIEMQFAEENWAEILTINKENEDNGGAAVYLRSEWVKINGVTLQGVGVKYKGNSSYHSSQTKNPFNISLDEYVSTNNYQDYTSLKLANIFGDPSFVREVLSYEMLNRYMESGKCNFAQVYVNGQYLGLYSNAEPVNKSFCKRHFGSRNNTFVECSPVHSPTVETKSNLKYKSNNQTDYEEAYELKGGSWQDFIALCNTVTNDPEAMGNVLDVDKFMWYLAFNNIACNIDSYVGVYSQNYYVYQNSEGRFMVIPWDFNMSFGGFANIGIIDRLLSLNTVQRQQLALNVHSTDNYWPVIKNIYANDQWRKMYLAHCKTIFKEYVETDLYLESILRWQAQAKQSVGADKNKFYSLEGFYNSLTADFSVNGYAVNGLKTLMEARKVYLSALPEFTATQPMLYDHSHADGNFMVMANDVDKVWFYYRLKGDGNGAFTAVEMTQSGNTYTASIPLNDNTIEYYFYAENIQTGAFLPERAAYIFFSTDDPAGTSVSTLNKLQVYPNPAHNNIYIVLPEMIETASIQIYSMTGQAVLSKTVSACSSFELSVSKLPQGVYSIVVFANKQKWSSKLIIY